MTQQHPITPPPELVQKWARTFYETTTAPGDWAIATATQAARWGADQELEACCEWLQDPDLNVDTYKLRAARRPKPPSLKEQALIHFESFAATFETSGGDSDLIRRALEQLDD
jgi:hypothetical protein